LKAHISVEDVEEAKIVYSKYIDRDNSWSEWRKSGVFAPFFYLLKVCEKPHQAGLDISQTYFW
jgi:hypothetical protein